MAGVGSHYQRSRVVQRPDVNVCALFEEGFGDRFSPGERSAVETRESVLPLLVPGHSQPQQFFYFFQSSGLRQAQQQSETVLVQLVG